ncbi:DUF721 domain-containing protein [bacterium]|nr:DUF721 domain-containing protein [bacterium]
MARKTKKNKLETPWSNIGDVLPSVLSSIVKKKNARPKNLDSVLRGVIDQKYVKYTKAMKVEGDTLYVKVLSSALYSELVMMGTDDLVSKIQQLGSFPSIKRVVYRR